MDSPLDPHLAHAGAVVLDGGLATALEDRGHDLSDELWSARVLADDPEAIVALHVDYLRAGADVVTSASYQATHAGFARAGWSAADADALLTRSVELARTAVREYAAARAEGEAGGPGPLVAASVGPYGAFLANGAEYTGDYGDLDVAALVDFHRPRLERLLAAGPDVLALETIPSADEVRALVGLLAEHPAARAWLSLSCPDGANLADGTPLGELARELEGAPGLVATGVNCVAPRHVGGLLARLGSTGERPLVAYPNSGEAWDAAARAWRGERDPADFATAAPTWRAAGARLIGGCCRTGPDHVRALRARLR